MAILYGMGIGILLHSLTSNWDATSKKAMKEEDPYVTVTTHHVDLLAHGTISAWLLEMVELRRTQGPLLKFVNNFKLVSKIIIDRARGYVFCGATRGSESNSEPEMTDVGNLIESDRLPVIKVDGCRFGCKDRESQLPHKKPSICITSMVETDSVFAGIVCKCHQHEPWRLTRFVSRTKQAAE